MFKKLTIFRESLKQRKLDKLTDDLRNNSLNIRMKAVRALGKIGDPRAVMPLLSLLSSASNGKNEARQIVIDTITQIGKPAITLLVNSLRDENGQTRAAAAEALEKLGWQPTVEIEKVYYFAAKGQFNLLVPLGATAVEPLIEMLGRKGFSESGAIVSCLGKIGDLRAVEPLIKVLTGNLSYLPSTAAVALGNIGDLRAVEPLIKMLTDDNEIARYARYEVAIALGSIGDPRAIESLKKALNDRTPRVRAAAAEALEKLRWQPTVEIEKVYYFAAKRKFRPLIGLGSIAVEGLINFLQHEAENVLRDGLDPTPLETVIEELGEIGDARAVQELAHMLDGGYARVQEAAAKALGKISDPSAVMVLIHATISYNTFHEAKMAALEVLTKIGEPAVEPLIDKTLKNADWRLLEPTVKALVKIGDPRAVIPLLDLLNKLSNEVQKTVIDGIIQMGKPAVEPLIETLLYKKWGMAAMLLGEIGDVRAVEPLISFVVGNSLLSHERAIEQAIGASIGALKKIGEPAVESLISKTLSNGEWRDRRWYDREQAAKLLKQIKGENS